LLILFTTLNDHAARRYAERAIYDGNSVVRPSVRLSHLCSITAEYRPYLIKRFSLHRTVLSI